MYLLIDLSTKDSIHLALFDEHSIIHTKAIGRNRELLALINNFFIEQKFTKERLKGVAVVVGTGSFTSTRIAAVVANTFGYVERIPVLAIQLEDMAHLSSIIPSFSCQPVSQYISPTYSGQPNIGLVV